MSSASAARADSSAASAQTVMNARSVASWAAMRSRCARTTSTGETCLVAIIRPRSAMDVQCRSATSEYPVLRGGLDGAERQTLELLERFEQPLDRWTDRLELGVGPVESAERGRPPQRLDAYFHAREHTTRMRSHDRPAD